MLSTNCASKREPAFGVIKEAMGFRRFSLRGHQKVTLEWDLVCLAYDVKRLHRPGAALGGGRCARGPVKPVAPRTCVLLAARKPAQTGLHGVLAWFERIKNQLGLRLARLRVNLRDTYADPACRLFPKLGGLLGASVPPPPGLGAATRRGEARLRA